MLRSKLILLYTGMLFAIGLSAQHISLVENKGEIGIMSGVSIYRGDIANDVLFYKPNFGAFYKKQLNDYIGLRFNYEYISLGANDIQSLNYYNFKRGLYFTRVSHDVSVMGELNFLRFLNKNRNYSFTPYFGFGFGAWKSISGSTNLDSPSTQTTLLFPLNFGFKYNVTGNWNVFTEVTYRFTNSDKIDYFADDSHRIPAGFKYDLQASSSGNDQYFSAKMGISYNFVSIYGPDKPKKNKKGLFSKKDGGNSNSTAKKGLFSFFKRK